MNNKKFLFQSLIGGAALVLAFRALIGRLTHAKPAPKSATSDTSFKEIDAFIEAQMKRLNIPGAALGYRTG